MSMSSAATGGTAGGDGAWSQGDWALNLAGSGQSVQSASPQSLLLLAVVIGAAWLLLKRK